MQANMRSSDGGAPWERRSGAAAVSASARLGTRTTLERAAFQLQATKDAFSNQRRALQSQGIAMQRWSSQGDLSVSGTRAKPDTRGLVVNGLGGMSSGVLGVGRQTDVYFLQNKAASQSHDAGRAVATHASRADFLNNSASGWSPHAPAGPRVGGAGQRPPLHTPAPALPMRWSTSALGLTLRSRVQKKSTEQGNATWARSLMGKLAREARASTASPLSSPHSPQRDGARSRVTAGLASPPPRRRSLTLRDSLERDNPVSLSPSRVSSWTDRDGSESIGWGESVDGEEGSGSGYEDDSGTEGGESQYCSSVQSSRQGLFLFPTEPCCQAWICRAKPFNASSSKLRLV